MIFHACGDVEVSGGRAQSAGVAFARDTQARTIAGARRDAHFDTLGSRYPALPAALRARIGQLSGSAAAGTRQVEAHGARHLAHVAGTLALGAGGFTGSRPRRRPRSVARIADFV